jgi:DNA-binding sugar fermentation-stimulating protein
MYKGIVIKRPSATCKSPYVADILINGEAVMAHAPALGCCGLSNKDANVLLSKLENPKGICKYRIELAITETDVIVGLNPKLAEKIVEEGIMKSDRVRKYKREHTLLNSRFDFVGIDKYKNPFVLEVKTVPLINKDGISYFPDGYRKKKNEPVSPRALKHLDDLIHIAKTSRTRAIMCYVIQRGDSDTFLPSDTDPIYKTKFYEALEKGVEIKTLFVDWNKEGIYKIKSYKDFIL